MESNKQIGFDVISNSGNIQTGLVDSLLQAAVSQYSAPAGQSAARVTSAVHKQSGMKYMHGTCVFGGVCK